MRKAKVMYKNEWAGTIIQTDDGTFEFSYEKSWLNDVRKPPVSLTLPKQKAPFYAEHLFPVFYHMLPEGTNKQMVCYHQRIDENDDFGVLMATAKSDAIGAVRIDKISE